MYGKFLRGVSYAMLIGAFLAPTMGCPSPQLHQDVMELQKLHQAWRSGSVAKPGVPQAKLDQIAGDLERVMADMEELTR